MSGRPRRRKPRRTDATGRSLTGDPFVRMPWWVLQSERARDLPGSALKVLLYLTMRLNGFNNGEIVFGVRSGCLERDLDTAQMERRDNRLIEICDSQGSSETRTRRVHHLYAGIRLRSETLGSRMEIELAQVRERSSYQGIPARRKKRNSVHFSNAYLVVQSLP